MGFLLLLFTGCEDINDHEKFQKPEWLNGKLYTAISSQEYLSLFSECLQLAGYDTILDVSGAWTVMAPTNGAVERYLADHQYSSVEEIPSWELNKLVKSHIIQNPWTLEQLKTSGQNGWRDENAADWHDYSFKFQTIFQNPDQKYWIKSVGGRDRIVMDSTRADRYKIVKTDSRKYAPLFYDAYFGIHGISGSDYSYYFDRPYEPGYSYFAGARVLKADLFAENGFLHVIDRVTKPLQNAEEILETAENGESYHSFLEMVYWHYPIFKANDKATFAQASARYGGFVDTLWNLSFSGLENTSDDDLLFDIQAERIWEEPGNVTDEVTRLKHKGLVAPTDPGFNAFIDEILTSGLGYPHWTDIKSLPRDIVDIIILQHFSPEALYPSSDEYQRIFQEPGRFQQNESDIIRKEFGSNCTFIGVDSYTPDRAFTSVTGPVFCRPKYSWFRLALQYSDLLNAISTIENELCFFPILDDGLRSDSSLLLNWLNQGTHQYNFLEYDVFMHSLAYVSPWELANRLLNHFGTSVPNGSANKEFIRTLRGNYIIWNNADNTVRGTRPSTKRYNGLIEATNHPEPMPFPIGNSRNYGIRYWFNFDQTGMDEMLSGYPEFYRLLIQSGLINQVRNNEDYFTIFVPSDAALDAYNADTLTTNELRPFLERHFVEGNLIFTDNKVASGSYNTLNNTPLQIETEPDVIRILDASGLPVAVLQENENRTNRMISSGSMVTAVVHEIDTVLSH